MAKLKICIDSGHYGKYNRSPANKSYYESEAMWELHLLQKKYLEEYGFEVITTRSKQANDLALHTRGTKSKGCALFISDHSNATGSGINESIDHVAVYHLTDDKTTECDDISKAIANKLAPVIADVMDTKTGYKVLTRKAGNDRNGDGIMNDNYYGVLHGARTVGTPGLILEHSFHTNTRTTNWLLSDSNLDKLAKAEADALAEYFGMSKAPEKETEKKEDIKPVAPKVDVLYQVWDDVLNKWLPNVKNLNDYAGIFGHDVCGVFASLSEGNIIYKVHYKGGKWLPEVKNRNDYAGLFNKPIDALMMKTDTGKTIHYAVHLRKKGKWLPFVTGYDEKDYNNGYAGILGQEIDAIKVYVD